MSPYSINPAPLAESSTAAAGMLATGDPHNPSQLSSLANLSISLYPNFLDYLSDLSGLRVPFQTNITLQALPPHTLHSEPELTPADLARLLPALTPHNHRFILLDERSLDPRQLASTLLAALRATPIDLQPHTPVLSTRSSNGAVEIQTPKGLFHAKQFVDCTGAWASATSHIPNLQIAPKKGQMLAVSLPASLPLKLVLRTPDIYIVPRTSGPNFGRAIIGATLEDAGFDKTVHPSDISQPALSRRPTASRARRRPATGSMGWPSPRNSRWPAPPRRSPQQPKPFHRLRSLPRRHPSRARHCPCHGAAVDR